MQPAGRTLDFPGSESGWAWDFYESNNISAARQISVTVK